VMHQPAENTAYCLNCTYEWPATWEVDEPTITRTECRWQLAIPIELVLSGWWAKEELAT
jgi:hypothetical protein